MTLDEYIRNPKKYSKKEDQTAKKSTNGATSLDSYIRQGMNNVNVSGASNTKREGSQPSLSNVASALPAPITSTVNSRGANNANYSANRNAARRATGVDVANTGDTELDAYLSSINAKANASVVNKGKGNMRETVAPKEAAKSLGRLAYDTAENFQANLMNPLAAIDAADRAVTDFIENKTGKKLMTDYDRERSYDIENSIAQRQQDALAGHSNAEQTIIRGGGAVGNIVGSSLMAQATGIPGVFNQYIAPTASAMASTEAAVNSGLREKVLANVTRGAGHFISTAGGNINNAAISLQAGLRKYDEAKQSGANGKTSTEAAVGAFTLEYISNMLFGGLPFEDSAESGFVTDLAETVAKKVGADKAVSSFFETTLGKVASKAIDFAGEGLEEVVSGALEPYIDRATFNPNAELASASELFSDFIDGIVMSIMLGGGSAAIEGSYNAIQNARTEAQYKSLLKSMPKPNTETNNATTEQAQQTTPQAQQTVPQTAEGLANAVAQGEQIQAQRASQNQGKTLDEMARNNYAAENNDAIINTNNTQEGYNGERTESIGREGRSGSLAAAEQSNGMAELRTNGTERGTGEADSRQTYVSGKDLGIETAVSAEEDKDKTLREHTNYNEVEQRIIDEAKSKGQTVRYFTGDLWCKDTHINPEGKTVSSKPYTVRALVSADGKNIWIKADYSKYNVEQLYKHEDYHTKIKENPNILAEGIKKLTAKYKDNIDALYDLINAYAKNYSINQDIVDASYIIEEMLCDAYAGIDILDFDKNKVDLKSEADSALKAERGGAKQSEAKASKEEKWYPKLTKAERQTADRLVERADGTAIDEYTGYDFKSEKGHSVFVIYSTADESGNTMLYAVSGEKAGKALDFIKEHTEVAKRGIDRTRKAIDEHIQRTGHSSRSGNSNTGRTGNGRTANGNAAVSQRGAGQESVSRRNLRQGNRDNGELRALRNTLDNGKTRYSLEEADTNSTVNRSMSMDQAKQMVQRAFALGGIKEYYEGEYIDGYDWLKKAGADEVAMYVENEYTLQEKYLNKIPAYIDGDITVEEILEAYLNGTLTGSVEKPKAKRLDTSKSAEYEDERFYAPKNVSSENPKELYELATQKITKANKDNVTKARAKILFLAHSADAANSIGISNAELNKKLRTWGAYPAKAIEISNRINSGVAAENRWTGIQNCSILNKQTVSDDDIKLMVKDVTGKSDEYKRAYIGRTMLALDTHINWGNLSFEFLPGGFQGRSSTRGMYSQDKITIANSGYANTVAHEMGHALDSIWGRELFGKSGKNDVHLSDTAYRPDLIENEDARQFYYNFRSFIDSITDQGDIRSSYTQDAKETFARFVAKFVEFADETAGNNFYKESSFYNDRFTANQYIEFARLLQEKAMLDAQGITKPFDSSQPRSEAKASREESDSVDVLFNEYKKTNDELRETEKQLKELTKSEEHDELVTAVVNSEKSELADAIERLKRWEEENGIAELNERKNRLSNESKRLYKEYEAKVEERDLAKEKADIEKSGLDEAEYFRKQAVKVFGYTPYYYDAGYIVPNGKMLNFTGEKGKHHNPRAQDHRAIGQIYATTQGSDAMTRFMNDGNVRIMAESPGIDISNKVPLSKEQYATIRAFADKVRDEEYFNIDFSDERGRNIGNIEYEGRISGVRIVNDIKRFFETGEVPETSSVSNFHYSREEVESAIKTENELLKEKLEEIKTLKKQLQSAQNKAEYWQGQTKRTKEPTLRENDVKRVARDVIKRYDSTIKADEITADLKALGEYMARGGDELTWSEAKARATKIARDVIENAEELTNGDDAALFKEVKTALKRKMSISAQDAKNIPDFGEWRKHQFGRVNIGVNNGGTPIDVAYQELASSYPGFFPDDITHPADQAMHMADVFDDLRPIYENPFSYQMEEAVDYCANEIIDSLLDEDVRQTVPTFADKQAQKLGEQKYKDAQKLEKLREEKNAKIDEVRQEGIERTKQAIERERDRRERQMENLRNYYANRDAKTKARMQERNDRQKLLRIVKRLQKKHYDPVTKAMLPSIVNELDATAVSITGKSIQKLSDLREWYRQKTTEGENLYDPNFIPDKDTLKKLERLEKAMQGKTIGQMSIDEVRKLTEVLQNFEHNVNEAHRFQQSQIKADIYKAGIDTINDIENAEAGKISRQLSPLRAVHRIIGYKENSPMYIAVQEMIEGERKADVYVRDAVRGLDKWLNDKDFMRSFYGKKAKEITITGVDAKTGKTKSVAITPAMRMSLIMHSKNMDNMRHVQNGGVKIPDMALYKKGKIKEAYENGTRIKITRAAIARMESDLSSTETQLMKAMHSYFNNYAPKRLNAASVLIDGYEKFNVEEYFPISVDSNFLSSDYGAIKLEENGSLSHPGFGEERIQSEKPIDLRDINEVFMKAVQTNSRYAHQAVPLMNMNKLINVQQIGAVDSISESLEHHYGESAGKYLRKFMSDYAGNRRGADTSVDKMLGKIRSNYSGAVLTLAAGTAIKQAASFPTAAAVVSTKSLLGALNATRPINTSFIDDYTAAFTKRAEGFSTLEMAELAQEGKHIPKYLNWIQAMDVGTTKVLKRAAAIEVQRTGKYTLGSAEYKQAVVDMYLKIIEQTQPNYSTALRPDLLRSESSLERALVMFATQPMQNFNILYDSINNYKAKARAYSAEQSAENKAEMQNASKAMGKAIGSQVTSALVFALMQFGWDVFRKRRDKYEDEGELTWGAFAKGIGLNMLSTGAGLFAGGKVALEFGETLADKVAKAFGHDAVFGSGIYGFEVAELAAITDATTSLTNAVGELAKAANNAIDGNDVNYEGAARKVWAAAEDVLMLCGVPLANATTMTTSIARHTVERAMGKYVGGYYSLRITTDPESSKAKFYDLLYSAYQHGTKSDLKELYDIMLQDGFTADNIKSNMETRMKKTEKVNSVKQLKTRWVAP